MEEGSTCNYELEHVNKISFERGWYFWWPDRLLTTGLIQQKLGFLSAKN